MMEPYDIIDEHFFNRELVAAWELVCGSSGIDIEGYALSFEGYLIEIETMLDTSAIGVSYEHSRCDFPYDVRAGCSYDEYPMKNPFPVYLASVYPNVGCWFPKTGIGTGFY